MKVRVFVQWEERHQKFGHVEVDEDCVDNRAAILEAVEEADRNGHDWDTEPSLDPGRLNMEWWEDTR